MQDNTDKRYCVYFHKRASDGSLFYIGSGVKGKREKHFQHRSKKWHEVVETHGVIVEIYKDQLTLSESRALEADLIQKYAGILVNSGIFNKRIELTKEELEDCVRYDESSPTFLRWIKQTGPRIKVGHVAGNILFVDGKPRSSTVQINGKPMILARAVWVLHGNTIPDNYVIDHIDNNPHNNCITNLRCVTVAENSRNRKTIKASDMPVGISRRENCYIAYATFNGVRRSRSFSILKYGEEVARLKAFSWRNEIIAEFNSLGAGFTANHFTEHVANTDHISSGYRGVVGLSISNKKGCKSIVASVTKADGKRVTKQFSISKYGEDEAFKLAKEYRENNHFPKHKRYDTMSTSSNNLDNAA